MFQNHPIQLDISVGNEEELVNKLIELKRLYNNDVTQPLFASIITNLHNGQGITPNTWNSKTLTEWANFLEPYLNGENLTEIQIESIFNYLRRFHNGVIRQNANKFDLTVRALHYDNNFLFEYIGLTILEV